MIILNVNDIKDYLGNYEKYYVRGIIDEVKDTFSMRERTFSDGEDVLIGSDGDEELLICDVMAFIDDIKDDFNKEDFNF